jgi:uncharacterized protein
VLGPAAHCITADSPSYPSRHRVIAERVAREFSLRHEFIVTGEMEKAEYRANEPDRCYFCKQELFTQLNAVARERGIAAVLDGANADDRGDYRPGRKAARELGVRSPLDEADLSKAEIRELSRRAGLPTWDEPASACLSSRIPYHSEVTPEKLAMIERAEDALVALGFRVCRVRHHGDVARVELGPDEMAKALEPATRDAIVRDLKAAGYVITGTWPASNSVPTRWPVRSSRRRATRLSATSRPSVTATSPWTCRATGWAASTKASAWSRCET